MLTSRSGRRSSGEGWLGGAEGEVAATTGATVPAVQAECLGAEPLLTGDAKQGMRQLAQLPPAAAGMDVDFDHPGSGVISR